jgi:small subunit ribosomal protein S2
MAQLSYNDLLDAGVHFGHLTRKWDPKMAPYIFMEKNGIHIIDLNKTISSLEEASAALRAIVRSGRKVMFVATKKQAQEIVTTEADKLKMPYVTDRWLGGMLTNFATVRKSIKKMSSIDKMLKDEVIVKTIAKRERLMLTREEEKLKRVLGGITELTRLPAALFIVDVKREHIAVSEAKKLGIPVFAMCDTNSNPDLVDYPIPANDDAYKSISIIITAISKAIEEGLAERKQDKDDAREAEEVEAKKAADDDSQEAAKVERCRRQVR